MAQILHRVLVRDRSTNIVWYLCNVSDLSHRESNTITSYATVSGYKIADNFYEEPRTLNYKISYSRILKSGIYGVQPNGTFVYPSLEEFKLLIKGWKSNGIRLDIITYEDKFTNMVIDSISVNEIDSGVGTWSPTISLTEVREATVELYKINFGESLKEICANTLERNLGVAIKATQQGSAYSDSFFKQLYGTTFDFNKINNMEIQ